MAKLADALDLGSSVRKDVWVQVPPSAPKKKDPQVAGLFYFKFFCLTTSAHWFELALTERSQFQRHSPR